MSTYRELAIVFQAYNEAIVKTKSERDSATPSQIRLELEDEDVPLVVRALWTAALDPAALVESCAADYPEHAMAIREVAAKLRGRIVAAESRT
jgi:hypothetical protein